MEYKGYEITISEPKSYHYEYYVLKNEKEIAYEGYFNYFTSAMDAAKKIVDDLTKEKYTPTNRPPYLWISVENELPIYDAANPVLGIIVSRYDFTSIKKVYYFDGEWYLDSNDKTIKDFECRITHWQYLPALPE